MKKVASIKNMIMVLIFAALAGFAPEADASWLSRGWEKIKDNGKKVINTVADAGSKIVDTVRPIIDRGKDLIDKVIQPVIDVAKSGGWRELLGLLGGILGGGGTAGPRDTGGGGGDGEVGIAAMRPIYGQNSIDNLKVITSIDEVSLKHPNATAAINVSEIVGTKAGTVSITQLAKGFSADLGENSMLEVNGVHVLGVRANSLTFKQEAEGKNWRLAPNTTAQLNVIEIMGGQHSTVEVAQRLNMPHLEVDRGTTRLNHFQAR